MVVAQVGEVFVLEDADEPGHQRPLAVVARQDGRRAVALAGDQKAPELGDGLFLPLRVARKQPHRPHSQGVDEQRVGAVGAGVKQGAPTVFQTFQTGAGDEPVEGVDVVDEGVPGRFLAFLARLARYISKARSVCRSKTSAGRFTRGRRSRQKWYSRVVWTLFMV